MKRISLALAIVFVFAAAGGLAAEGLDFSFNGVRLNSALLPIPLPTGAEVEFRYGIGELGGKPLALSLALAGGYEDKRILRNDLTGDPVAARPKDESLEDSGGYRYQSPNFQWDLGLVQGLAAKEKGNLAEAFLLYRGRFDYYDTELQAEAFSDMKGLFGTSVMAGAAYLGVERDSRRVKSGAAAELSAEWGPSALNSSYGGATDFYRLNLKAQGFLPLFSRGQADDESKNLVSSYLAGYASVDYAGGDNDGAGIPVYVLQTFGGRELRNTLGGSVRGYAYKGYDAGLKAVASAEVRLLGPAMLDQAWFLPILYGFFDAGAYAGLPGATAVWRDKKGAIMSAGGGLVLDVFDFAYVGAYAGVKLPGDDPLYDIYKETKDFFWSIQFLLHF